jgi:predicted MPP superfamily phosphohydrolase
MKDGKRGAGVSHYADLTIYGCLAALLTAQWWISRELLRSAGRRWRGWKRASARVAIYLFGGAAAGCYVVSFLPLAVTFPRAVEPIRAILGGAVLAYSACAAVAVCVCLAVRALRKHLNAETDGGRRRALNVAGALALASPFVVLGYGALVERTDFRVREIDVPLPGLPADLEGLRVAQLSDIHLSVFLSERELARAIDAANELRPHVAVITGDLITVGSDPLDTCIRQLARLKADAGVFGCMGNHERFARVENYTSRAAAALGIPFLRGGRRQLRFGGSILNLAGVDYQAFPDKRDYLRGAERLIVPGACNVLLSHNPDVFPVAARQGWNLQLSGHTHGGQVAIEIFDQAITPARFFTPYVYGLFRSGASAAYVTRGIGTLGIPVRIGAPPEIVLLRLRKA